MIKKHLTTFVILLIPLALYTLKNGLNSSTETQASDNVAIASGAATRVSDTALRSPASFGSIKIEDSNNTTGDLEQSSADSDTDEIRITISPVIKDITSAGAPYIAATTQDLKSHPNVESLIQTRADSICQQLGVKNNKPHHRCKTFQINNVEDSSNDKILVDPLTLKTLRDRPNSVSFKIKNDYCRTIYAQEKDGVFCEQSMSSHEAQILHPKKFTQVTCLLRATPFPREPLRVKRKIPSNPGSGTPKGFGRSQNLRSTQ